VLVVKPEAECRPAGRAGENGAVPIAAREHELRERIERAGGGPVATRIEVGVHEEDVKLGLVLDGALEPAELVLEVLGRRGDDLSCNLDVEESVDENMSMMSGIRRGRKL
jgi:hypothetical protein